MYLAPSNVSFQHAHLVLSYTLEKKDENIIESLQLLCHLQCNRRHNRIRTKVPDPDSYLLRPWELS